MIRSYLPALVFIGLGAILGLVFAVLNSCRRPARAASGPRTVDPYECGLPSEVKQNFRFGISFYLIAMLFILFDIEVIFLFPVAIQLKAFGTLRADGDDRLHRPAGHRLRLRLAERSARMEVTRKQLGAGGMEEFRSRQLTARQMLKRRARGPRAREARRGEHPHDDARPGRPLGAPRTRCSPPPSGSPAARSR